MTELAFVAVAALTVSSALMTVTARNLVHAALFLAITLTGIGAEFLILRADFVGLTQLIVYVGAIAVLFMFGLMLTRAGIGAEDLDSSSQRLALIVSVTLFAVLLALILPAYLGTASQVAPTGPGARDLGFAIFTNWVLPFELVSILLLAALVGSVMLSRSQDASSGSEQPQQPIELAPDPDAAAHDVVDVSDEKVQA